MVGAAPNRVKYICGCLSFPLSYDFLPNCRYKIDQYIRIGTKDRKRPKTETRFVVIAIFGR